MNIVDISEFFQSSGELIQRCVLDIGGHIIQIIRYEYDNNDILVKVDHHIAHMSLPDVDEYVMSRI